MQVENCGRPPVYEAVDSVSCSYRMKCDLGGLREFISSKLSLSLKGSFCFTLCESVSRRQFLVCAGIMRSLARIS